MRINRFWEGHGLHLGGIWNGLGRLSDALGRLLAVSGDAGIEFCPNHGPSWSPRGLWDRFWEGLEKVLGGFGEVLGGFGEVGEGFQNLSPAHALCPLLRHILLQEPPRCLASPRGASQLKFMQKFFKNDGRNGILRS